MSEDDQFEAVEERIYAAADAVAELRRRIIRPLPTDRRVMARSATELVISGVDGDGRVLLAARWADGDGEVQSPSLAWDRAGLEQCVAVMTSALGLVD